MPDLNIVSSRPAIAWVPPQEIDERLDAYPFDIRFIQPLQQLYAVDYEIKPLREIARTIRCGPFGSSVLAETYVDHGIPLLRPVNLAFGIMDFSDTVSVSPIAAKEGGYPIFGPGTILFARVGNVNVGVLPEHTKQIALGPNVIGVDINKSVDPFFVGIFAASRYGLVQLERKLKVVAQPTITTGTVRNFLVPLPPQPVQTYIGDKVRLVERCRSRARELLNSAKHRFAELTHLGTFSPSTAVFGFTPNDRLTERMAAEFYLPAYLDLERHLQTTELPVVPIGQLLKRAIIRTGTPDRIESHIVPCILTSDIDPQTITYTSPSLWITDETHKNHKGKLQALDVVYTSVGPPVGEAALVLPEYLPMAVGGDVSVLRAGKDLNPGYLCLYLNTVFGQMQNDRYARGIRQRRVYPEDIESFLIPVPEKTLQDFIGNQVVEYERLNDRAATLVAAAKADVEALIEGRLDVEGIVAGRVVAPAWEEAG